MAILNPTILIPPFISPMPPYWFIIPIYMGDVFFDQIAFVINVPHLLFFNVTMRKPLPNLSIPAMLELAYIASKGFNVTIDRNSELYRVCFASLNIDLKLPVPMLLSSGGSRNQKMVDVVDLDLEINAAADLIKAVTEVSQAVHKTLDTAVDLVNDFGKIVEGFLENPTPFVKLIPLEYRKFELDAALDLFLFGFELHGSVYLLCPDEFRAQLELFHFNKRKVLKGVASARATGESYEVVDVVSSVLSSKNYLEMRKERRDYS